MTPDLRANASLSAPGLDECAEFEDRALRMLHRAWDNPAKLGEGSEICQEATALLGEIRQFCSPQDRPDEPNPARENFHSALKLAWLAVWRARDYTLYGVIKRAEAERWPEGPTAGTGYPNTHSFGDFPWFTIHYPLYDRDGNRIPRPDFDFRPRFAFEREPRFQEGSMFTAPSQLQHRPGASALRWALIESELPQVEGGVGLDSCLIERKELQISYKSSALKPCTDTICLGQVRLVDFQARDLRQLASSRFEGGLTLTGNIDNNIDLGAIETGPLLELRSVVCRTDVVLGLQPGVRRVLGRGLRIGGALRVSRGSPMSLEVDNGSMGDMTIRAIDVVGARFDEIKISNVGVEAQADFTECEATKCAFSDVSFPAGVSFQSARLGGQAHKDEWASFRGCQFRGRADFRYCTFLGDAAFNLASFLGNTNFNGASFKGRANFASAGFSDSITFNRGAGREVRFEQFANFSGSRKDDPTGQFQTVSFNDAVFLQSARFRNRKFCDDTSFDRATFEREHSFHGSEFHPRTSFDGVRFNWKRNRPAQFLDRFVHARGSIWRGAPLPTSVQADLRFLTGLTDSFRVLTSLSRAIDAPELAFRFHKEELRTRHHRSIGGNVGRPEAIVGRLYGWVADYGDSFIRPIAGLALSLTAFAAFYSTQVPDGSDRYGASISTALAMQFRPFAALDPAVGRLATSEREAECELELRSAGPLSGTCMQYHLAKHAEVEFRAASVLQTVLSVAFLFFGALGLRRKYQVS